LTTLYCVPCVRATSVIVDFKVDRIIVVADSRAGVHDPKGVRFRDDQCKLVVMGSRFVFATKGTEGYKHNQPSDPVPEWDARAEVRAAFASVPDHALRKVADAWGTKIADDFRTWYRADSSRVRGFVSSANYILVGIFAGQTTEGRLTVLYVPIWFVDTLPQPIMYDVREYSPRETPYAFESITQELLEGQTSRAKSVDADWRRISKPFPAKQRNVRWLEYLIKQTGKYDREVGGPAYSIEIRPNSPATWLSNSTCK
jgi:hypothetical protein